MRLLRAITRTVAFSATTTAFYFSWLAGVPLALAFVGGFHRWRALMFRHWAKAIVLTLGVKLNIAGSRPSSSFFLVTNHLSYLDVVVLAAQLDCIFVAKSEIAHWPLIGLLGRNMGTIFIDRRRRRDILRVNRLIEGHLRQGRSVVLFPEGTTTPGAQVLPFKSSLLEPAVRTAMPVHFASLSYRTSSDEAPASQSVCWWGEMDFVPHLWRLFALDEIESVVTFGSAPIRATDRKQLSRKLHGAISEIFVPVPGAVEKEGSEIWKLRQQCAA